MDDNTVFTLTTKERVEVRATAGVLVGARKVDDGAWTDACRTASTMLPQRLRARLREFRRDPGQDGALLIRNLPGAAERPTPNEPGSVERNATVGATVISLVSLQLGEVIAYRNEKFGALVQNVVPVPGQETQQSNAGSTQLEMHVENAFHPRRPDYVGLLCVRADHEQLAGLQVSCIRRAVHGLSAATRILLAEFRFTTQAPPSFGRPEDFAARHAVLTGDLADPDVQVDFHATYANDPEAKNALELLRHAILSVAETVTLGPGDLAIIDNRVALHGRTVFTPRYDGMDRWLYRTFVHLDHRRSRPLRELDGNVLA